MAGQPDLFIPNKARREMPQPHYGDDMRQIEMWSKRLTAASAGFPFPPNPANEEFNEGGASAPPGWFRTDTSGGSWGSLTLCNTVDVPGLLHLKVSSGAPSLVQGIYKTAPTLPFTMTTKLVDAQLQANTGGPFAGLFVATGTPGSAGTIYTCHLTSGQPWAVCRNSCNLATGTGFGPNTIQNNQPMPIYLGAICDAGGHVTFTFSNSSLVQTHFLFTFSGATINTIGLFVSSEGTGLAGEAFFEYVRFTQP